MRLLLPDYNALERRLLFDWRVYAGLIYSSYNMNDLLKAKRSIIIILSLITITAISGCKDAAQTQKPFSIQDLVTIKNGSIEILKEEDFVTAQEPLLSPDGNNLLFTTYDPGIGELHSESASEDEHASNTIIYTLDKSGMIKKQLETDGRIEISDVKWLTNDSFVYLSGHLREEDEGASPDIIKTQLYVHNIKSRRRLLSEFMIEKDNSVAILEHGILALLNEKTFTYRLNDIQTGASLNDLAANINNAISSYPKETDTTLLAVSKNRKSYLIETTNKPLWNSDVFLHNLSQPAVKIASLETDNSHFNYIAWDDMGIYLQGFREGDMGLFYKYNDGVLTKKEFPKDMDNCRNFAAGKFTYEIIDYPEPEYLKIIPFDPDDNENVL